MKKLLAISLFASLILTLTAGSALAFKIKDVTKEVGKAGIEIGVNKKLSDETGKCRYASATEVKPTGCNTMAIISALNAFRKTAEKSGAANDVDIEITAHAKSDKVAKQRAEYLRDQVKAQVSWWDYSVYYQKGGDNIEMKVKVD